MATIVNHQIRLIDLIICVLTESEFLYYSHFIKCLLLHIRETIALNTIHIISSENEYELLNDFEI